MINTFNLSASANLFVLIKYLANLNHLTTVWALLSLFRLYVSWRSVWILFAVIFVLPKTTKSFNLFTTILTYKFLFHIISPVLEIFLKLGLTCTESLSH